MAIRIACAAIYLLAQLLHPLAMPTSFAAMRPPLVDEWNAPRIGDPKTDPESWEFTNRATGGVVKMIDNEAITLVRPDYRIRTSRNDPLTGKVLETHLSDRKDGWHPKAFLLGESLRNGKYPRIAEVSHTYRVQDVKVGDWVRINFDRCKGIDICQCICVHRRPGAKVPPAPGEAAEARFKYHEQANADQAWEEQGLPYPERYQPVVRLLDGQFRRCPFPAETSIWIPCREIAPAPRSNH